MSRWKEFRREPVAGEWTRKQKRGYHRVRSLLWFWECHQFQVLWVTLSTAEGGDAEKLTYHHKQLRQRIERQPVRPRPMVHCIRVVHAFSLQIHNSKWQVSLRAPIAYSFLRHAEPPGDLDARQLHHWFRRGAQRR